MPPFKSLTAILTLDTKIEKAKQILFIQQNCTSDFTKTYVQYVILNLHQTPRFH